MLIEFLKVQWNVIKHNSLIMITQVIEEMRLPTGVMKILISLLHKGDAHNRLTNWRPITLLNVTYKLLAKVLQLHLQAILMEVIDFNQSAFLSTRYFRQYTTHTRDHFLGWTYKAIANLLQAWLFKSLWHYHWSFLFKAMKVLNIPLGFINMSKLLIQDAGVAIKVNGAQSLAFIV